MTDATNERFNALFGEDTTKQRFDDLFAAPPPRVPLDAGIPKGSGGTIADALGMGGKTASPFGGIEAFEELRKRPGPSEMDIILQGRREERAREKEQRVIDMRKRLEAGEDASPMGQVTGLNKLARGLGHGWDSAMAYMEASRTDFWERHGMASPDDIEEADRLRKLSEDEMKLAPEGPVGWFGAQVGQVAGSLWSSGKQAGKTAIAGAAAGAAAGAPAGGVGAIPGAISGAGLGLTGGFLADSFIVNTGSVAKEMEDFRGPNAETIDEGTIDLYSNIGGSIMAALDVASFKVLGKPFEAPLRRMLTHEIAQKLKDEAVKSGGRRFTAEYIKGLTAETITETTQQVVQDVTEDLAKQDRSADLATAFNDPKRRAEVINNAVQTALSTAAGMSVVAAPGGIVSAREDNRPDVPLTATDRASPIPDEIIQAGKNDLADAVEAEGMPNVAEPRPGPAKPPRAPVTETVVENPVAERLKFEGKVKGVESGGDPNAANPSSSASGLYQFTDKTWTALGGDLAKKNDPAEQERLFKKLTDQNERGLESAGIPVTAGNLYLAHFAGIGGAKALHANPSGKVEDVLGAKVVEANPFLKGMDASDVIEWANQKMGGKPGRFVMGTDQGGTTAGEADGLLEYPGESSIDSLKKATGVDVLADEEVDDFKPGERIEVAQEGQPAKAGTVKEVYGEGEQRGVVIEQDDGTTFDEVVSRARSYGAKFRRPATDVVADPVDTGKAEVKAGTDYRGRRSEGPGEHYYQPAGIEPQGPGLDAVKDNNNKSPAKIRGDSEVREYALGYEAGLADQPDQETNTPTWSMGRRAALAKLQSGRIDRGEEDPANAAAILRGIAGPNIHPGNVEWAEKHGYAKGGELTESGRKKLASLSGEKADNDYTPFPEDSGTLGIARDDMPQIKAEHRGAMVNFLNARGIRHEEATVPAKALKPTQAEYSPAKVQQAKEHEGGDRAILVSEEGHVIDGHHQWLAALDEGKDIRAIVLKKPVREVLDQAHAFPSSETAGEQQSSKSDATEQEDTSTDDDERPAFERVKRSAEVRSTESGKGIEVHGASKELLAKIDAAIGPGAGAPRKDGAVVYSKKHEDKIRKAIQDDHTERLSAEVQKDRDKLFAANADKDFSKPGTPIPALRKGRTELLAQYKVDHNADEMRASLETYGIAMLPSARVFRIEEKNGEWVINEWKDGITPWEYGGGKGYARSEAINKIVDFYFGHNVAFKLESAEGRNTHEKAFSLVVVEDPDGRFYFDSNLSYANGGGSGPSNGSYNPADRYKTMQAAKVAGLNAVWNAWQYHVDRNYDAGEKKRDQATWNKVQAQINAALPTPRTLTDEESKRDLQDRINKDFETLAYYVTDSHDIGKLPKNVLNINFIEQEGPDEKRLGYGKSATNNAYQQAVIRDIKRFRERFGGEPTLPDGFEPPRPGGAYASEPVSRGVPTAEQVETFTGTWTTRAEADADAARQQEKASEDQTYFVRPEGGNFAVYVRQPKLDPATVTDVKPVQPSAPSANPQEIGAKDFAAGKQRVAPAALSTPDKAEWYKGWDRANLAAPVPEAPNPPPAPAPPSSNYGAGNKLVSRERADEVRAALKAKFKSQLNAGIDPEMLALGTELAVFHIEAGARKFADFVKAVAADMGVKASQLKPFLRAWYLGAQMMIEDSGGDIDGMDGPGAVRAALAMIEDEPSNTPAVDDIGDVDANAAIETGTQDADRGGDADQRAPDVSGIEGQGRTGEGLERPGGPGAEQLRDGDLDGERSGPVGEPEPVASGIGERNDAGAQRSSAGRTRASRRVRGKPADRGANFVAPSGGLKRTGSWRDTAERNLDIIELVNQLEAEQRPATPDEQTKLAQFVGWGAGAIRNELFRHVDRKAMRIQQASYGEWASTINRARDLLQGEDLATALQSTQYAHYTSEGVVRSIWDGLRKMGFGGGRILEPGMGIGHFFTAAPADMVDASRYTGIELDAFTAKVAKYLLPQENVIQGDFIKQAFPDGFFDAAIGNPPFAATKVMADPAYKRDRFSLHDYFFAKSLDKVRSGGLVAFVTSRYTMDKLGQKARQFIADRADLVGAIRLPQTAFKENAGTEVVTDVLFLQKRAPGAAPGGQAWLDTKTITVGGEKVNINQYFAEHPEMVLGKHATRRGQFSATDYTVEPYASKGSIEAQFAEATGNLPEGIYTDQPHQNAESLTAKTYDRDFAPSSTKEGGVYLKDGKVLMVDRGSGVPVEEIYDKLRPAEIAWLKDYVPLRDLLKDAQRDQLQDGDWEKSHAALVKGYRAFTKKHGRIKEFTPIERKEVTEDGDTIIRVYRRYKWDKLLFDIEAPLVQSLERITDTGEIVDGPFLRGRTLNKPVRPQIESVSDALAVNLDEIGRLDIDYIGGLLGKTHDEVIEELGDLIYRDPSGEWQTADAYLSGDVVAKLEEAEAAAVTDPDMERNVAALKAVQPTPLTHENINVKLGAPWIKPEDVSKFAAEVLEADNVPIRYEPAHASWTVEGASDRWRRYRTTEYGTQERSPLELLDAVLNNRSIKVTRKEDKKEVVDPAATAAANDAAKKIAERFRSWLWEDAGRAEEYAEIYNRRYNNLAPRRFDGSYLTTPGLSSHYKLFAHQKRAIARIIQTGDTYLNHAVGAGKTLEMIVGGMEMRRLGLVKKPMYVVPNHMLNQFAQEFLEAYPAANIMVADDKAFHTDNRRRFLAQAALNDPDAIILTHSSFGKIDSSDDMKAVVVDRLISELESAMEEAKAGDAARHTVSKIEKRIEQLKSKFEAKTGTGKDKLLPFDEMGVDFLFIDEAHEFRKLDFATNRAAKGIDSTGSGRALDLFIKSQWLKTRNPGRSLVLASGTPVTNTMAELFTVMRYMDLPAMERDGIAAFDAWASMFGEVVAGYEQNAAGGYEVVERFSKFVNVPELMKRVRQFMDVLVSEQLGDLVKRPKMLGGLPIQDIAPASPELEDYMKGTLLPRLEESRKWKPTPDQPGNPDPVINIITDARLASIDLRFVTAGRKPDPNSKLNRMITRIAETYKRTAPREYLDRAGNKAVRPGAAQIVFSAVGFGEQVAINRGFDVKGWIESELVRQGVDKSQIAWMGDANTHAKKEQLQKDVRSGKVRILFGSPKNMGTGLNVQDRLFALHYLSPPWYPADVEQPHGRIIRQGNQHEEVEVTWYATKGTYDSTQWGMVSRKQKFIEQAMIGDDSVRTIEDISEANKYEMAAALAAGDDRLIRVANLSGEISRLENLREAHARQQVELRSRARQLGERYIPSQKKLVEDMTAAAKLVGYGPFQLTANGGSFDKHGEGGQALIDAMQKVIDNNIAIPRTEVGRYRGHALFLAPTERGSGLELQMQVGDYVTRIGDRFDSMGGLDAVGLARRIEGEFSRIPSNLRQAQADLAEAEKEYAASAKKVGAPFAEGGQLADAIAERAQLQAEIAGEADKPKASVGDVGAEPIPAYLLRHEDQLRTELQKQLRAFGIADRIALRVGQNLELGEKTWQGSYWRRVVSVATDVARNPQRVLAHETIHAMKALGLFTETEWKLLTDVAWKNPERRAWVKEHYGDLDEAVLREEAAAEEFADYFDLFQIEGQRTWLNRMLVRAFDFIVAVARAVQKIMGRPTDGFDAQAIMDSIIKGKVGRRETGFGEPARDRPGLIFEGFRPEFGTAEPRASVVGSIDPAEPDFGGDTEKRWQEARKGIGTGSVIEKAQAWWQDLAAGFSRHWRDLPNEPRFADVQQQLRKLEAAPDAAMEASVRHLKKIVGDLSAKEYDLFSRKVVLDDLSWDTAEGRDLPFGFTPSTLVAARREIDAQINLNPKLIKAIRERKTHNHAVADAMVEAGVLTRDQIKNPAYFRHMVLEYARAEAALARSPSKVKSPYWAKRMGSTLDINANLLEAELDWMMKAQVDTTTANTIEWIKASPLNIRERLRKQAKDHNKAALAAELASNPSARKEDGWFRSNIARGLKLVQDEIDAGTLDPIPAHLQQAADDLAGGVRDGEPPFALMAWILDGSKPGAMGAGMVLKYSGLRKQWMRKLLDEDYHDPEDIAGLVRLYKPEGMVAWQPKEGRHLFTAKTISEHALDMFVTRLADTASPGLDRAELASALGTVRQQLVVGGDRYTMVIPEELGATLDEFGDRHGEGMVAQIFGGIQSAWKQWVLINPRRFFKYNINNMTGDLDAIIAGNPGALTKVPEAWRILRDAAKGKIDPRYQDALDRGVFTSGLSAQEIPDINRFSEFRHLTEPKTLRPDKLTINALAKLWRVLQDTTNFREALFRLAAYIDYDEKIESGKPQLKIGYGASVPNMVDAVTDPKDRAALLARDLVGDYGAISVAGGWLRRYLISFWSWQEINAKRYWRLTANTYRVSKARGLATGGLLGAGIATRTALGLYIRMGLVFGLLYMWNHMLFPDEEDDLSDDQKRQLHLIIGRDQDNNVVSLRTQGALSDVFGALGFVDFFAGLDKWQDGQGTIGAALTDMAKAPINRVATAVTPIFSVPVEQMLGEELWPDIFNPRQIHDRWRHLFSTFSLEHEYDQVADKPTRGYARSWTESVVYRKDPDEMAYDEAKGIAYDWLERVKGQEGGGFSSARGEALRDYRLGLRYGDQDAADKALVRYAELGGTEKSLAQSIAKQHPLGPIAKKDRAEFLDSLTDEQLDTFAKAEDYWKRTYANPDG